MKCLSIRQPWAWAICAGAKDVENRSWSTKHRGTIAIHASASKQTVKAILQEDSDAAFDATFFVYGAIIGVADVVDCVELNPELEENPWALGTICWKLENARFLAKPIPMKGKLNLFNLSDDIAASLQQQSSQAAAKIEKHLAETVVATVCPTPLSASIEQAISYFDLQRFADTVRRATQALEFDQNNAIAFHLRAAALNQLERFEEALRDASKAIELDPSLAWAHYESAVAKDAAGDEAGARQDYERARELGADLCPFDELDGGD